MISKYCTFAIFLLLSSFTAFFHSGIHKNFSTFPYKLFIFHFKWQFSSVDGKLTAFDFLLDLNLLVYLGNPSVKFFISKKSLLFFLIRAILIINWFVSWFDKCLNNGFITALHFYSVNPYFLFFLNKQMIYLCYVRFSTILNEASKPDWCIC